VIRRWRKGLILENFSKRTLFALLLCFGALVGAVGAYIYILNSHTSINPTIITCQTTRFEFERPLRTIGLQKLVGNTYADNEGTSITLGLLVYNYLENSVFDGSDCVDMNVSVSARVPNGFVESVNITFREDYRDSQLMFHEVKSWPKYFSKAENLSITDYVHFLQISGLKASIELTRRGRPKAVYFTGIMHWLLRSPQNASHQIGAALELTYFNGTVYEKAVLPIEIVIWADAGGNFETARAITVGDHRGFICIFDDPEDYYKIWVEKGPIIEVKVSPLEPYAGVDFDLYLYNPSLKLVANATEEEIELDMPEEICCTAEVSGYWYIRVVNSYSSYGWYQLSVSPNWLDLIM